MDEQDRTSHDPFAPLPRPEPAPSFPEDRLRRIGVSDADVETAREQWATWTPDEQRAALEALHEQTDEELAAAYREDTEAGAMTGDGAQRDVREASDALVKVASDLVAGGFVPDAATAVEMLSAVLADEHLAAVASVNQDGEVLDTEGTVLAQIDLRGEDDDEGYEVAAGAEGERPDDAEPGVQISGETADGETVPPVAEVAPGGPGEADGASGEAAAEPGAQPSEDVPSGNVDTVVEWIGTDPVRARRALLAEGQGANRKGVMTYAEGVIRSTGTMTSGG